MANDVGRKESFEYMDLSFLSFRSNWTRKTGYFSPVLNFSQDLLTVCRELNLENSVEELMRELGADEHGRISYQEFLRCRLALRPEIEALRSGKHRTSPHHTHTPEYLPTSSDNSLGKCIFLSIYLPATNQSLSSRSGWIEFEL